MSQRYQQLKTALAALIPDSRLIDDPLRTMAYGTDASFYRMIPQLVVRIVDESEVTRLLQLAQHHQTPITFRAAGTSLSGQAVTDSVLAVMEGNAWREHRILDGGKRIRLQPGIIGSQANGYLAPLGRKIGPDPASINTARIGGIAANNASGMCCGVAHNSYQTLEGMRVVLADGSVLDTGDPQSCETFAATHSRLLAGLAEMAQSVQSNTELADRIRHKYQIKNTTGYSLNALVDYTDPVEILQHLMIGSEGTLGFISEITYRTLPEHPCKASSLVLFPDVAAACTAVVTLKGQPVDAVEMMDRAALRSVQDRPGMPAQLAALPDTAAALLIETRASDQELLATHISSITRSLQPANTLEQVEFTAIPEEFEALWKIRKGLFPSVGAVRASGTAVVIEDIAFPIENLAAGTLELQQLFGRHGYHNAIIFGHALEGNLHFVITPDFGNSAEVERYRHFMDELCHMVVDRYDGSLKAEHSTGRNIAPYVELEWGSEAYALMQRIKQLFDPYALLNPGVILNGDPQVHIQNLKPMPPADPLIDSCIECGFCEPICPSRNLSLTPRQRIVVLREISRLRAQGEDSSELEQGFRWQGEQTCAADGLCATRCPVDIDTGAMIRRLRSRDAGTRSQRVAFFAQRNMGRVTAATRGTLATVSGISRIIGPGALEKMSSGISSLSSGQVPTWDRWMPRAASSPRPRPMESGRPRVVYLPSCVSRSMGTASCDHESRDLQQVVLSLLEKAGLDVVIPSGIDNLCCGLPFSSKGLDAPADAALQEMEQALWQASYEGTIPILCDTSPCTERMQNGFSREMKLQEPVGFILEHLLPRLRQVKTLDSLVLHITCSARKMGLAERFLQLARACARDVILPEEEGCCGFAGDKGFTHPELNAYALSNLKSQIPEGCSVGYSNSRTCEIGLSRHSGIPFRSIAYLVDECYDSAE
jgi:D-lactate dehydrogenase